MALNVETENTTRIALNTDTDEWWLWTPNEDAIMVLNAETEKVMALNAERRCDDGSECQNGEVTLNVKLGSDDDGSKHRDLKWWWLWTLNYKEMMREKYVPVWHAAANLNPLEGSERDSMSPERRSAS